MAVYLLHLSRPLGNERHQASHYLGYSPDRHLDQRIADHRAGQGARITQVAVERGITLTVVRTWPGLSRTDERRMKNQHHHARLCPVCRGAQRKGA